MVARPRSRERAWTRRIEASIKCAPCCSATISITARASTGSSPTITGSPALRMPAFSYAMLASEFPRWRSWSNAMEVIAPTTGAMTLVASNRPPRPTSMTAVSTSARRKISKAMAVVTSKNVGVVWSAPFARSRSDGLEHVCRRDAERLARYGRAVDGDTLFDVG